MRFNSATTGCSHAEEWITTYAQRKLPV